MKGLNEFILEFTRPLNDTFMTESGVELYGHKKFHVDRLANRVANVISPPQLKDTVIKEGYQVMIEPSIFHKQIYRDREQEYTSIVDKEKNWFAVLPSMIVLYRENEKSEWKGHLGNIMVMPIPITEKTVQSDIIIMPKTQPKYKTDRAILLYSNENIKQWGANEGDELVIRPDSGLKFWIEGKEYWWVREVDVLGVVV